MATYHMRADGTATSLVAADGTGGTSTFLSVTGHNSYSSGASASDIFELHDDAGAFRGVELSPGASGSTGEGNEITYIATTGDTPVIAGSEVVTGWTDYAPGAGSTWQAAVTTNDPRQVFMDDVRLTEGASATTLTDLEWFWSSNVLYVRRDAGDPSGTVTIEAGTYFGYLMQLTGDSYLTFDGLTFKHGSSLQGGVLGNGGSGNIEFVNCNFRQAYMQELKYYDVSTDGDAWEIHDCYFFDCGSTSVALQEHSTNWHIHHNEFDSCCNLHEIAGHQYSSAIRCTGDGSVGHIIEYNSIHADTLGYVGGGTDAGGGIWLDEMTDTDTGCIIRYNLIRDLAYEGIRVELCDGAQVYYNVVANCTKYSIGGEGGISIARNVSNNEVYNNTVYGCARGICCFGDGVAVNVTGNIFKNNIATGNSVRELSIWAGGDNDDVGGSGNVYEYNCFGAEATGFVNVGDAGGALNTYAALESWYGSVMNNTESEPDFVAAGSNDFRLNSTSPCIDTGVDVGLTSDFAGRTVPG